MLSFYRYIFYKSYFFCINTFKEKEFPQIWATGVVTFLITINIIVLLDILEYTIFTEEMRDVGTFYKYFAMFFLGGALIYIHINKRYLKIIEYYSTIPSKKKRLFRLLSIAYYIVTAISFFLMGALLRSMH